MPEQPNGGDNGSGGGTPPAPPQKTVEQRLQEMEEGAKRQSALLQSTQEELKRVNNLNGVLMQRLNAADQKPPASSGGMDVNGTVKLRRDFSQMDPAAEPDRFARELIAETAEQVSSVIARNRETEAANAELRRAFYTDNKDLVGFEIEVGYFSNEVQVANPGISFVDASKLIAQKTREYVKNRGLSSTANQNEPPNPQHTLPPSSGSGDGKVPIKPPSGGGNEPFNPDKAYEEDMKDYAKMRTSERDRDGMRSGKA